MDYYRILGLSRDATLEEIRESYFASVRTLHPDANPEMQAREQFLIVQEAYEVLSNPGRRDGYDKTLAPPLPPPQVHTIVDFSRKALLKSSDPQLIYVLLDISTSSQPDRSKLPPAHITLVIDRSTSMQGERMDMVKSSATQLIKHLKPQDWISVVIFSDRAEVLIPPTRATEINKFEGRISLIRTGGSTELAHGLQTGLEQLISVRGLKTIKQLILLTDGHTYGDESVCLELAEKALKEGVTINSLGIGHEWNDAFLDEVSSKTGGNALFIKSSRDLQHFFENKLNNLSLVYAKGTRFEIKMPPQVELRYAFRIQPESSPLGNKNNLVFGDLLYNTCLKVLLEFLVKDISGDEEELDLFKGKIWLDLINGTGTRERLFLDVTLPIRGKQEFESPSTEIIDAMTQISMYRLQERASQDVKDGKIESATKHLQYLATNLLSTGNRSLAHSVLVEAENIRQSRSFSKDGDKRIKYGTRALLLPSGLESK